MERLSFKLGFNPLHKLGDLNGNLQLLHFEFTNRGFTLGPKQSSMGFHEVFLNFQKVLAAFERELKIGKHEPILAGAPCN